MAAGEGEGEHGGSLQGPVVALLYPWMNSSRTEAATLSALMPDAVLQASLPHTRSEPSREERWPLGRLMGEVRCGLIGACARRKYTYSGVWAAYRARAVAVPRA